MSGQNPQRNDTPDASMNGRRRFGLRGKLLLLLLGFGVVPLTAAILLVYRSSRAAITEQAENALRDLAAQQAVHLDTELRRQRLLLRTIVGQLTVADSAGASAAQLAAALRQALPEDGVFDGLRLVSAGGEILVDVALRDVEPHWPSEAPAADWATHRVELHREGDQVLAYVVGLGQGENASAAWLEGHVRAADFPRLFSMPPHLMAGAELGVLDEAGNPIFVAHEHGLNQVVAGSVGRLPDTAIVVRGGTQRAPFMVAFAPAEDMDWYVAAVLPLDVALAPVSRIRNLALGGTAILVALLVVTSAMAARTVTTPLAQLADAVQEFGRSESFAPVRQRSQDEVGSLVRSFNRMAQDLVRSREEIERLHEAELERTHQLATVGELASGVAHEIRNPLTGVMGAIELALKRIPQDDPSRPLLNEAEMQLRRIEATTTQLLRYARPPELREVVVDANLLVDRTIRVIEPQARTGRVALVAEPTAEPVLVRVDPEQVVQVLVNLGLNALQAMTDGGRLTLRVVRRDGSVEVAVIDTGLGVPPDVRRDIFRPFFTTKHQGTGLGLSISQQLIERHGGALRLEETPGGGATFVVVLPLQEEGESS